MNRMHPEIYLTEQMPEKDMAEVMIEDLQQFINGERKLEEDFVANSVAAAPGIGIEKSSFSSSLKKNLSNN